MNILLLKPPAVSKFGNQRIFGSNKNDFRKPPLDLMMISGYLEMEGFANTLVDANTSIKTMEHVLEIIRQKYSEVAFIDLNLYYLQRLAGVQSSQRSQPFLATLDMTYVTLTIAVPTH